MCVINTTFKDSNNSVKVMKNWAKMTNSLIVLCYERQFDGLDFMISVLNSLSIKYFQHLWREGFYRTLFPLQARERRDGFNPDYQGTDVNLKASGDYKAVGPTVEAT
jgi:hypothetical protein